MSKNIGKNISKTLSGKYSQKVYDRAKESETDILKSSSKRVIQKAVEKTCDLISHKSFKKFRNRYK